MFSQTPFIRILVPFVIGIVLHHYSPHTLITLATLGCCLLLLLWTEQLCFSNKWRHRKKIGCLIQLYLVLLGLNCQFFSITTPEAKHPNGTYLLHLLSLDKQGKSYHRFIATIYPIIDASIGRPFRAYTYIPSSIKQTRMGDVLLTLSTPEKISSPPNPGSFDFAKYAHQKNIHHTLFIQSEKSIITLEHRKNRLLNGLYAVRTWIIGTIQQQLNNAKDAGLTEALLIGYKEDMDKSIQSAYTLTGVSHIIAVSGMHLGLIFYVLHAALLFLWSKRRSRQISLFIILPLLWAFALLTGSSPSVLRSVVVFTILILGKSMLKKSGSINALLASAFLLLVKDPLLLTDIGFQLSYAAVLSILIFEPLITKWLYLKNKLLKYLWSLIAITIAAQLLTTPLVLFHFRQFPLLFLLTNLVAIPLSSLVLLLAIALCLLSAFSLPTSYVVQLIHVCLTAMNSYIENISTVPHTAITTNTNLGDVIGYYLIIVLFTLTLNRKYRISPYLLLSAALLLAVKHFKDTLELNSKRQLIVLHSTNHTILLHQHGRSARLWCSAELFKEKVNFKAKIRSLGLELGIQHWHISLLEDHPALIGIQQEGTKHNILLLSFSSAILHQLTNLSLSSEGSTELIADGSNKLWKIKQWEKQAQELHLRLHSTQQMGAFIAPCGHE